MWPELSPYTTHVCGDSHEKSEGIWHKIFSSFMTCDRICNKSNIAGLTIVAESTYRSRAPDSFSVFWEVCVVNVVFTPLLFYKRGHDLFMLFAFIYVYWCPTRFTFHIMFVSFSSNMTGTTSGSGTSYLSRETEFLNIILKIKDSL